jgi:hypothetical protein
LSRFLLLTELTSGRDLRALYSMAGSIDCIVLA